MAVDGGRWWSMVVRLVEVGRNADLHFCELVVSKALQSEIARRYGVNSTPYFSEKFSAVQYAGGRNSFTRLSEHSGIPLKVNIP